jgi:hypothetical protein
MAADDLYGIVMDRAERKLEAERIEERLEKLRSL